MLLLSFSPCAQDSVRKRSLILVPNVKLETFFVPENETGLQNCDFFSELGNFWKATRQGQHVFKGKDKVPRMNHVAGNIKGKYTCLLCVAHVVQNGTIPSFYLFQQTYERISSPRCLHEAKVSNQLSFSLHFTFYKIKHYASKNLFVFSLSPSKKTSETLFPIRHTTYIFISVYVLYPILLYLCIQQGFLRMLASNNSLTPTWGKIKK